MVILGAVGTVVVVVAALVVIKVATGDGSKSGKKATRAAVSVTSTLSSLPSSLFDRVGVGGAQAAPQPPKNSEPALTAGGKPEILYVGAEFCPYCAAERWSLTAALDRFGSFSNLQEVRSSNQPGEVARDTATLSYHGATYSSQYLDFVGKEIESNQLVDGNWTQLDTLTAAQSKLFTANGSTFPYLNLDGKYIGSVQYNPSVLGGSKMDQPEIARAIMNPSTTISKDVIGSANLLTARMCQLTNQQPAAVCGSSGVKAAASAIAKAA